MDGKPTRGGHECEFIHPPLNFQTECSICLLVLRSPRITSCCGHNFCKECIERVQKAGKCCPLCNKENFILTYNRAHDVSLQQFEVYCPHREIGCEWREKLEMLDTHLNVNPKPIDKQLEGCAFVEVQCYNDGCGLSYQRRCIVEHQCGACHLRVFSCEHCHEYESTYHDVTTNHWPVCKCYPLPCPHECRQETIQRQSLEQHLNEECPLQEVECEFKYAGCEAKLPRRDMPDHLTKDNIRHMTLLSQQNQMLVREKQELMSKLLEKDEQLRKMMKENRIEMEETTARLKEELQAALEQEKDLVQRHESTNRQLQQKLADATDRMECYRQERDLARQTVGKSEAQLQVLQGESNEKLTAALQKAMEEAEVQVAQLQNDLAGKEGDITTLSAKVTDYQSKSRRYRDERNQFKKTCESLERQVAELRSALDDMVAQSKVQPHSDQDSVDPSTPDYTSHPPASLGHTETTTVNPPQVQKVSESEGQEEHTCSPIRYTTEEYPNLPHESPISPLPKSEGKHRSSLKSKIPGSAPRSSSLSSSTASLKSDKRGSSSSAAFLAEVRSKEETVRLWLQRPAELPSVESKPPIIVKRTVGTYERGTLMFLGQCGDRMVAGVQLELPDGNNDGTLKRDGKRYFRCEPNYGLYLPPDKIYVELGDDTASV